MTLQIHDTATRTLREFTPLEPGKVGIYLCGATVQAPPHVGHIRSGIAFDVVRRWLTALGYNVTLGVLGGFSPLVATWLVLRTENDYSPAFMIMAAAAISFAAILKFDETHRLRLQAA